MSEKNILAKQPIHTAAVTANDALLFRFNMQLFLTFSVYFQLTKIFF